MNRQESYPLVKGSGCEDKAFLDAVAIPKAAEFRQLKLLNKGSIYFLSDCILIIATCVCGCRLHTGEVGK